MKNLRLPKSSFVLRFIVAAVLLLAMSVMAMAQSNIASGSIQGVVTDPSGAIVPNATVIITNNGTGQKVTRTSSSSGAYNSGPLAPGAYTVRVENKGFQSIQIPVTVQVGVDSTANAKMQVGAESETVEVTGESIGVNTEQATVQGVLNSRQIENLPVNGRNFLDLAQLEPGVQIQDGGDFDPTKNGFSSVSFGGRAGRTARITVDGIDISDENVGTTTQNLSAGAISEFQISQSTLDLSTELTSSGAVNVVTKSGTNALHGEGFYLFRDKDLGLANFPSGNDTPFQRNHFGGSLGGPLVKNNLFFFLNAERVKQDQLNPVVPLGVFGDSIPKGYQAPFRDNVMLGRMDWNGPHGMRVFYKFNYNYNGTTRSDAPTYQPFTNKNNTPSHGAGVDFTTGAYTHSIRYGFVNFNNRIADAVLGDAGLFNPLAQWGIAGRNGPLGTPMRYGPNRLAPQTTIQHNNQLKYDGSRIIGSHLIRFGADYNHIGVGGLASFYGNAPEIRSNIDTTAQNDAAGGPFPGGASNPLNYRVNRIVLGNGFGFGSERPAFGYSGGGFTTNRFAFYLGDSWKIKPNFTLTAGLRYQRDTGRAPTDIAPITCDQIDASLFPGGLPCSGSERVLDQFQPGFGARVQQPNHNWGPQLGFAWDPKSNGKTVIRGGMGLYYENNIVNNILFDRSVRLASGEFNVVPLLCGPFGTTLPVPGVGNVTSFPYNGGTQSIAGICGLPFGQAAPLVAALQQYYQSATAAAGAQGNSAFVGNLLGGITNVVAPNYKTPYSVQMNIGIQRELRPGMILSADFLRNVGLHYLVNQEVNHVGDVRYFNKTAAQNAIAATLAHFGAANIDQAIAAGATADDFVNNGLGSGAEVLSGLPASAFGLDPNHGVAFAGRNPGVGTGAFLVPNGRSAYTALQMKLQQRLDNPLRGVHNVNFQVSYSLSQFNNIVGVDQDFSGAALDNANPGRYFGPSSLDRKNQISWGGSFQVTRKGPQFGFIGHVFSPLAVTATVQQTGEAGEIFRTDFTGDGTTGDVLPGTNIGSIGRKYNGANINDAITFYNSNYAGKPTPAGQLLINNGLFTEQQLISLGLVAPTVDFAPDDQLKLSWLKTIDLRMDWPIKVTERFTLHPTVALYNAFNFANYNTASNLMSGILGGPGSGSVNGTAKSDTGTVDSLRSNVGTGTNGFGAPRQMEFGLRLVF